MSFWIAQLWKIGNTNSYESNNDLYLEINAQRIYSHY